MADGERIGRIAAAVSGFGDVGAAIQDLLALPDGMPGRSGLAAGLIGAAVRSGDTRGFLPYLGRLVEIADQDPPASPEWVEQRAAAYAMSLSWQVAEGQVANPRAALAEVEALIAKHGQSRFLPLLTSARVGLRFAVGAVEGDAGATDDMVAGMKAMLDNPLFAQAADAGPLREVLESMAAVMTANDNDGDMGGALEALMKAADKLPPGHDVREAVAQSGSVMGMLAASKGGAPSPEQLAEAVAAAGNPGLSANDQARYRAGVAMARLRNETDPARAADSVEEMRRAVALTGANDPERPFYLAGLALALSMHNELTNRTDDLREAEAVLREARDLAGGPQHPQWSMISELMANVHNRVGETPGAHLQAVEGLRTYVWRVMMQTDLTRAVAAVRDAARDATGVARQCLAANDPASAVRALDAGRGLALFAATEVGTVADRLTEAGRPDLAERWRAAAASGKPEDLPGDLRHEVLTELTAHSSAARLLDPPPMDEIRQALVDVDADALAYLVPGEDGVGGFAVAVAARGPASFMALPNLLARDDDVLTYLRADRKSELAESLERLCDWMWRAAIGPLAETYLPRLGPPPGDRVPRVVLVPMGDLARLPWQAARHADGTYAIHRLALSQIASARMLVRSASQEPVPSAPVGLVVGDPDGSLLKARDEAYAIWQRFFPGGRYLGTRPDGTPSPSGVGTRAEVERWFRGPASIGGAVLHLACHASTKPGNSAIGLAGDEQLRAESLVRLVAAAPEHEIALVVLSACESGVALTGYDEAYSLGSALLAGGVRSVICTQWGISDEFSTQMMYVLHHHLRAGLPTWEALRQAQLWMLDDRRKLPAGAPAHLNTAAVRSLANRRVVAWAGFVHSGQ